MADIFDFSLDAYSGLNHDAKVNLIINLLPGFIEEGISANDALGIFRDNGLGINRSEFLGLYRDVLGVEEQQNRVRYVTGNSIPSENILTEAELPLVDNYRFVYRYGYLDPKDNSFTYGYAGLDRTTLDTVANMEAKALAEIKERYPELADRISGIDIWKGFKAG